MTKETYPRSLDDLPGLSEAEQSVLEGACSGQRVTLGDGTLPAGPSEDRSIRAGLIRLLLRGGCDGHRTHEKGVEIVGAFVKGQLEITLCRSSARLGLFSCRFAEPIQAMNAELGALGLNGSAVPGLNAQGAIVKGDVFLSARFRATGEVRLSGAEIGGQLACAGGRFEKADGFALNAQDINVTGGVFLSDRFRATGEVSLSGAQIGGVFSCIKGRFEKADGFALNAQNVTVTGGVFLSDGFHATGEVRLSGAQIGGQLACDGGRFEKADGYALNAQDAKVTGGFIWKNVRVEEGAVDFMRAHVGVLSDDQQSWPMGGRLSLNGFRYNAILGADTSAEARLKWLVKNQSDDFQPQPYEQLAKVLGGMGHRRDRSLVLTEMERRLRGDIRRRLLMPSHDTVLGAARKVKLHLKCLIAWLWDTFLHWVVGYGHRPHWAFWWSLGIIGFTSIIALTTWRAGDIVPNSPVVLVSAQWQTLAGETYAAKVWTETTGKDYESFSAFTYAADVFIPLIDFGQEPAWAPSTERGPWGRQLYWLRWVVKTLGWLITALGAAAVTGIIRRDP